MIKSVQQVGKRYLVGMILIMIILGFINSIGLVIIGLDNPFLFGFMAAVLAIVPYVGTTIGAAIPILYAFMTLRFDVGSNSRVHYVLGCSGC